jgi:hypothetical protein
LELVVSEPTTVPDGSTACTVVSATVPTTPVPVGASRRFSRSRVSGRSRAVCPHVWTACRRAFPSTTCSASWRSSSSETCLPSRHPNRSGVVSGRPSPDAARNARTIRSWCATPRLVASRPPWRVGTCHPRRRARSVRPCAGSWKITRRPYPPRPRSGSGATRRWNSDRVPLRNKTGRTGPSFSRSWYRR